MTTSLVNPRNVVSKMGKCFIGKGKMITMDLIHGFVLALLIVEPNSKKNVSLISRHLVKCLWIIQDSVIIVDEVVSEDVVVVIHVVIVAIVG